MLNCARVGEVNTDSARVARHDTLPGSFFLGEKKSRSGDCRRHSVLPRNFFALALTCCLQSGAIIISQQSFLEPVTQNSPFVTWTLPFGFPEYFQKADSLGAPSPVLMSGEAGQDCSSDIAPFPRTHL